LCAREREGEHGEERLQTPCHCAARVSERENALRASGRRRRFCVRRSDAEADADSEPDAEADAEPDADADPESDAESDADADPESDPDPESDLDS
jgi:hypothetical protein